MAPLFLTLAEAIEIHRDQIARYGGAAGIRDMALLESATAAPASTYGGEFLHADLFEMGAAYLFHLLQNHPFLDGNKRTGAVATLVFLALNGIDTCASEEEFEQMVLAVANSRLTKADVAAFFRQHARGDS